MEQEKNAQEEAEKQATAHRTCPERGYQNPEGVKFCQECGARLGVSAESVCPECKTPNPPGTRFCGECGSKMA